MLALMKASIAQRILVIDDNAAIHGDFRKVLGGDAEDAAQVALAVLEAGLFGEARGSGSRPRFEIDSAYQGQEGVEMVRRAWARDARTPWRSSTCACRPAGTA